MLKTILASVREYKRPTFVTIFFAGIEALFEIVIPFWMSYLIDRGIQAGNLAEVWRYGLLLLLFAGLQMFSGVMAAYKGSEASAGFSGNLRHDMFARVQDYSFANIDKFSTASIVTRLTTDITYIRNAYNMLIRMAVRSPLMMIFAIIAAFSINREVSMVFVVVMPVLAVALGLIIYFSFPIFNDIFANYDHLNNVVQEDIRGIRVVKSFNRQAHEIGKFNAVSAIIRRLYFKAEAIISLNGPIMQLCMYACMMLISWFGAHAIVASGNNAAQGLTTGELTALFTYAMQILMGMMMISFVFVMILIALSPCRRVAEILTEESTITSPEGGVRTVRDGEVCFEHVYFNYRDAQDQDVLSDINLTFPSGSTIGILGATGASKSSLVQLIPRLYDVASGRVTVGGVDVRDYDIEALREEVAMVLQKNELFGGSIRDNLRWGNPDASDADIAHVCELACADEFIAQMPDGYDTHIEQGGSNVSGGQKQRLCIARALLKRPKILILDDSTSAVDTRTDAKIQAGLREYIPETTKIIIAQRVSSLAHADQIVVMDEGRVVATGDHETLLAHCDIYRDVYESQQKGGMEE
ncbi:MAG: ABC transporter ATP-binding protein [Peptococcaceae bacterium]|nr:ABC transporter ATP-binding protein [Peptococcaceae bacterium]